MSDDIHSNLHIYFTLPPIYKKSRLQKMLAIYLIILFAITHISVSEILVAFEIYRMQPVLVMGFSTAQHNITTTNYSRKIILY